MNIVDRATQGFLGGFLIPCLKEMVVLRNIQEFTEEDMAAIRAVVAGECGYYSPVEGCRSVRQPCHMTSVNARASPPCRYFAEFIAPRSRALRALYRRQRRTLDQTTDD